MLVLPLFLPYPLLSCLAAFSLRLNFIVTFIGNMKCWFHSCPYLKFKIWFQKYSQTKRGELKVMLTHGDWHDFTVSVLKCKEVRKIYRDHPYGLKFYHIVLPLHFFISFTLHNTTNSFSKSNLQYSSTAVKLPSPWLCEGISSDFTWTKNGTSSMLFTSIFHQMIYQI